MFSEESQNYFRTATLVLNHGTETLALKFKTELSKRGYSFTDYLKKSFHDIFHLYVSSKWCCLCTAQPTSRQAINFKQYLMLYTDRQDVEPQNHPSEKHKLCCCRFETKSDISEKDLDISLLSALLTNLFDLKEPERKAVETLRTGRNNLFHGNSAAISVKDFKRVYQEIQNSVNQIARTCSSKYYEQVWKDMVELEQVTFSAHRTSCCLSTVVESLKDEDFTKKTSLGPNIPPFPPDMRKQIRSVQCIVEQLKQHFHDLPEIDSTEKETNHLKECIERVLDGLKITKDSLERDESMKRATLPALRREMERTNLILDQHVSSDNIFLQTKHLQEALHTIYTKNVLVISGIAGSGKTTLTYEVMHHMRDQYSTLILPGSRYIREIDPMDKVIVFIDDICGRSSYSERDASEWRKEFDVMLAAAKQGNVRFVFSFRENVYEDFEKDEDNFHDKLFSREHRINISKMSTADKENLVKMFCERRDISLSYDSRDHIKSEDKLQKIIDLRTFREISITETITGFPQVCYMFFSNPTFFEMGIDFFRRPGQSLISKIDQLRKSRDKLCRIQYGLLAYMMLFDQHLDVNSMMTNQELKEVFNILYIDLYTYECILDGIDDDTMKTFLCTVDGSNSLFSFRHQTITEAVFISFSKRFPKETLLQSNIKLIGEFCRSESYPQKTGELVFQLPACHFEILSERLVDECVQSKMYNKFVKLQVFQDERFTQSFISCLQNIQMSKSERNEIILDLLYACCNLGNCTLLGALLKICDVTEDNADNDSDIGHAVISLMDLRQQLLSTSIRKGDLKAVQKIVDSRRSVLLCSDNGLLPIHFAALRGHEPIFNYLWNLCDDETKYFPSFTDSSGRRCVHFCAMRGYNERIREIRSRGNSFVMAKDAMQWSALHYAAYGGQCQTVEQLIAYGLNTADRTKENFSVLQTLLISLNYEERSKVLPPISQDVFKAISFENSVLWNNEYYKTLLFLLRQSNTDLDDLGIIIDETNKYNVAHWVVIDDAVELVDVLLDRKNELFHADNLTPFPKAWDIATYLGRWIILEKLIESEILGKIDIPGLMKISKEGRKQAHALRFKDRRLLLHKHERQRIWPNSCFPFVIFGTDKNYDNIDSLLSKIESGT